MFKVVNNANGRILELSSDQVITIEKYNTLFNSDTDFFQDVSWPGNAEYSESNKLFFNLAHLVETPTGEYNFPVTCYADEIPISAGNINFRIGTGGFEFNLEANYTAINVFVKNIRITEILTDDLVDTLASAADLTARMLDSVQFPDKYPYIFFPVYNPGMGPTHGTGYQFMNYYDNVTQKFVVAASPDGGAQAEVPFFKLGYILQQLFNYLGFASAGNFFTDPETKHICIYTRLTILTQFRQIQPCMTYMPNMLVSDFLKQLRERFHLAIDFDLATKTATVETVASILRKGNAIDLSQYISSVSAVEQEVPESSGFTVTLKSDQQDALFKVSSGDKDTYPALYQLVAGDGSTVTELDCSTTNVVDLSSPGIIGARYASVDQRLIGAAFDADFYPPDLQFTDPSDPTTVNNFPLRLIKYLGYTALTGGGNFPCSEPVDLGDDDKTYFNFLNSSKRLIPSGDFPPSVLASLKTTGLYCFKTAGYNYTEFLVEKIGSDIKVESDLIATKMYVRTTTIALQSKVNIMPVASIPGGVSEGLIKAYFDPALHGITELPLELYGNTTTIFLPTITIPTNIKGTGGQGSPMSYNSEPVRITIGTTFRIIIRKGNPKFFTCMGVKTNFSWSAADGYWYVDVTPAFSFKYFVTSWISF